MLRSHVTWSFMDDQHDACLPTQLTSDVLHQTKGVLVISAVEHSSMETGSPHVHCMLNVMLGWTHVLNAIWTKE